MPRLLGNVIPWFLFAAALALFMPGIEIPVGYVYDEVYHAYTAEEYVRATPMHSCGTRSRRGPMWRIRGITHPWACS
jgi:hypothetical protein